MTCTACPLQVEGELLNGWCFYFRCRFDLAELGIGATPEDAVRATLPRVVGPRYAAALVPGHWEASLFDVEDEDGTASELFRGLFDQLLGYPSQ